MKNILLSVALSTLLFSCNMKEKIDIIVYNANVYRVDSAFTKCTAFAVNDGKILATGTDDEILNKYRASEYLDAEQKPVAKILPSLTAKAVHLVNAESTLYTLALYTIISIFSFILQENKSVDNATLNRIFFIFIEVIVLF
jgi:ABC-type multidrug transport system ATPase subunit